MRQLRRHVDAALAPRPQRPLLVQRVRPLLQDERHQQTPGQTKKKNGKPVLSFADLLDSAFLPPMNKTSFLSGRCGPVVENTPLNEWVMGSNPAYCCRLCTFL